MLNASAGVYASSGETFSANFGGFGACQQIFINASSESGCGSILGSQFTNEFVFAYTSECVVMSAIKTIT